MDWYADKEYKCRSLVSDMKQGKLSRFVSPSQREKSKEQYHNDVTHQQGLCGMSSK